MPGMDGWEASRRIRTMNESGGTSVKIIAMTANRPFEDMQKSQDVGMDDLIGKPIDFNALLHKLNQFLT
jgi:CheY-like chemotaxis protein